MTCSFWLHSMALAAAPVTPAWVGRGDTFGASFGNAAMSAGDEDGDGYDDVLIAAPRRDDAVDGAGAVFLYRGTSTGLALAPDWTVVGDHPQEAMGWAIGRGDVNGDGYTDVVVGSPFYDGVESGCGRAQLFLGSALGLDTVPSWTVQGSYYFGQVGLALAVAGDVNGDGYDDIIVGGPREAADNGQVFLYLGAPAGPSTTPDWTVASEQLWSTYGKAVAAAGDVNGDGYDDVLVGAPEYDNGEYGEGIVDLYLGSATGLALTPDWTAESNETNAYLGYSVASAGDVNDDGYDDVIIGAYLSDDVYVYHGSATGLGATPAWTSHGDQLGSSYGISVAGAGDVDNDGYDDVLVGADLYDANLTEDGKAYLYRGTASGLEAAPAWTASSNQAFSNFGRPVAFAGDVNGDGPDDILVGAERQDGAVGQEGTSALYLGWCGTSDADADGVADGCDQCVGDDASGDLDLDLACALNVDGSPYDCDDAAAASYPGAPELCDAADNNCDGAVDEGCTAETTPTTPGGTPTDTGTAAGTDTATTVGSGTGTGTTDTGAAPPPGRGCDVGGGAGQLSWLAALVLLRRARRAR